MSVPVAILRLAVKIANNTTRAWQPLVSYARKTSVAGYGPVLAAPVSLHAIIDFRSSQVKMPDGTLRTTKATVTLLDVNEVIAATSGQGITIDDVFTLPSGDTGPILSLDGFVDAGTGHPLATEVMLG